MSSPKRVHPRSVGDLKFLLQHAVQITLNLRFSQILDAMHSRGLSKTRIGCIMAPVNSDVLEEITWQTHMPLKKQFDKARAGRSAIV